MMTENQKTILEHPDEANAQDNTADVPVDGELFAGQIHKADAKADDFALGSGTSNAKHRVQEPQTQEGLSAQELFAGNEDFYKHLTDSAEPAMTQKPAVTSPPQITPIPYNKRFSTAQKVLAVSIVLIVVMLLFALLKSPSTPVADLPPVLGAQQTSQSKPLIVESIPVTPQQVQEPQPAPAPTQSLSLNVAESFYLNGDYAQALLAYKNLRQNLPARPEEDLTRDFLDLRMALCMGKTADYKQANRLFRSVSHSHSPLVRVVASHHRSLLEMQKKQYLNARTQAYQAIALIDAVNFDKDWALSLKGNCHFLAAEAVTRKVLLLCDGDKDLPENLWNNLDTADDPFAGLNEMQLRTFLNSGSEQLSKAVFGPQIQQFGLQSGLAYYDVTCKDAPIEELLTRFAANAGLDIHWSLEPTEIGIRKQAVSLYMSAATTPQFVTAASGCTGLLARLSEKGLVDIFNPAECSYVSEQISLLSSEAVRLWQKFLLRFPADPRIANTHFALGLLQAQQGRFTEPIAEYKLVANRFSGSSLAPFALLNSSKLKISLRDYAGAVQDLKQLVEQYPDTEIAGKAYLCLAETSAKAGLKSEAARVYRKVYNLSLSAESESAAAIGAGKCFYQAKDYESAAKWLVRYIKLAKDGKSKDLYSAYFILGKTYLALEDAKAASDTFQYALQGGPSQLDREEYIETVSALVEGYMQQGNFVSALDILENIHSVVLSQQESITMLLLKSRALTAMGLASKAIVILGDSAEYISDPQLKAKVSLELAYCYAKEGNFELAHEKLAEILVGAEPGPLMHKAALKLADTCLKLGQDSQAVSICLQLLNLDPSDQIKQKTLELLAASYNQQKDYDRAASALLGRWK